MLIERRRDITEEITIAHTSEKMKMNIGGRELDCKIRFSMLDLKKFYELRDSGLSGRKAIIESICRNLVVKEYQQEDLIQSIEKLSDEILEGYIEKIVSRDQMMQEIFAETNGDCYDRFYVASRKSWEEQWQRIKPVITASLPKITGLSKSVQTQVNISGISKSLVQFSEGLSKLIMPVINLQEMVKPLINQMSEINKKISVSFENIAKTLSSFVSKISIPTYSEEEKEKIKESYVQWGAYGWSTIPNAPLTLFFDPPENLKEANRIALKYCNDKAMEELFLEMKDLSAVKKSDFEDAVFCFKTKRFRPCAMLLFSLLDAKFIRMQKKEDRNRRNNIRPSGSKAANNIKNRLAPEMEDSFYIALSYLNLFRCIVTVFEQGEDFKKQPDIINRNFLDHGMFTRKVKRMDCVQLFLLYYNFVKMIEWIK